MCRTFWVGYPDEEHTIEPRKNLVNAATEFNKGWSRYNKTHLKRFGYKKLRLNEKMKEPEIAKLLEEKKFKCELCYKMCATEKRLEEHMNFHKRNEGMDLAKKLKLFYIFKFYIFLFLLF